MYSQPIRGILRPLLSITCAAMSDDDKFLLATLLSLADLAAPCIF